MKTATSTGRAHRLPAGGALALALSAVFLALLVTSLVIKTVATGFVLDDASLTVALLASQAIGLVLVLRRPDNRVGWIVCLLAWAMSGQDFIEAYTDLATRRGWSVTLAAWIDSKTFLLLWLGMIGLFLYFPDGRLPSPRWRIPARFAFGAVGFGLIVMTLIPGRLLEDQPAGAANPPNPTALPAHLWEPIAFVNGLALMLLVAAFLTALASLVVRYRRSVGVERLQIRWVVSAAVTFAIVTVVSLTIRQLRPEWLDITDLVSGIAFVLIPASIGVAVLRFHLYEIDRIVSRTFVYAVLTVVLGATYVLAVTLVRAVTEPLTGDAAVAVAASTLLVAALFQPSRSKVQGAVDRRFNRARYDAVATVERFSARLRDEVDLESLHAELLGVVRSTMQPATTSLWLREAAT
jgi:hypothetical protein